MVTAAIRIGQLVRRRIDPLSTPLVGEVGGLVFGNPNLALVRWPGSGSTFEPEDTLIEAFRAAVGFCHFCHERIDPESDEFVVVPDVQTQLRKVATSYRCPRRPLHPRPTAVAAVVLGSPWTEHEGSPRRPSASCSSCRTRDD